MSPKQYCEALGDLGRHEYIPVRCACRVQYCLACWKRCPKCDMFPNGTWLTPPASVPDGTLTAIRAIAAHVTDSRLAMAAIRVLLEEK